AYLAEINKKYEAARERFASKAAQKKMIPFAAARENAFAPDFSSYTPPKPERPGVHVIEPSFEELRPYIDWSPFFYTWGLMMRYPNILDDDQKGAEARKLYDDAQKMIDRFVSDGRVRPRGVVGLFPAASVDEDIVIYKDEARTEELRRVHGLRQQ